MDENRVWPPGYAVGHNNDHFVAERLIAGLREFMSDDAYDLRLDLGVSGTVEQLEGFAQQLVEIVRTRFSEVRAGTTIGSPELGRRWRFFRGDRGMRAFQGAPETGLVVNLELSDVREPERYGASGATCGGV